MVGLLGEMQYLYGMILIDYITSNLIHSLALKIIFS
jgi:hypothetical protein